MKTNKQAVLYPKADRFSIGRQSFFSLLVMIIMVNFTLTTFAETYQEPTTKSIITKNNNWYLLLDLEIDCIKSIKSPCDFDVKVAEEKITIHVDNKVKSDTLAILECIKRGHEYSKNKKHESALAEYEKAEAYAPNCWIVFVYKSAAAYRDSRFKLARKFADEAVKLSPYASNKKVKNTDIQERKLANENMTTQPKGRVPKDKIKAGLLDLDTEVIAQIDAGQEMGIRDSDTNDIIYFSPSIDSLNFSLVAKMFLTSASDNSNKKDFRKALSEYTASESIIPDQWLVAMSKGVCYTLIGKKEDAFKELERALRLNPKSERVKKNITASKKYFK